MPDVPVPDSSEPGDFEGARRLAERARRLVPWLLGTVVLLLVLAQGMVLIESERFAPAAVPHPEPMAVRLASEDTKARFLERQARFVELVDTGDPALFRRDFGEPIRREEKECWELSSRGFRADFHSFCVDTRTGEVTRFTLPVGLQCVE